MRLCERLPLQVAQLLHIVKELLGHLDLAVQQGVQARVAWGEGGEAGGEGESVGEKGGAEVGRCTMPSMHLERGDGQWLGV